MVRNMMRIMLLIYNDYITKVDAHADINTPSMSVSGNMHGMYTICIIYMDVYVYL